MSPPNPPENAARITRLLDFEREPWANKNAAIRLYLGMSPTRYWQELLALIDNPAAEEYDAGTVRRLHEERDERRAFRENGYKSA